MAKKMTQGQKLFIAEQRKLKERIKRAEDRGIIIEDKIKELTKIGYNDISPQKAVTLRKRISTLKGEMLRRPSNIKQINIRGDILSSKQEISSYLNSSKQANKLLAESSDRKVQEGLQKEIDKKSYKSVELAKRKQAMTKQGISFDEEVYKAQQERLKKSLKDLYGVTNFLKGTESTLSEMEYTPWNVMFMHWLSWFKRQSLSTQAEILKWANDNGIELTRVIYESDGIAIDEKNVAQQDLSDLIDESKRFGYRTITLDKAAGIAGNLKKKESKVVQEKIYSPSIGKRMYEEVIL